MHNHPSTSPAVEHPAPTSAAAAPSPPAPSAPSVAGELAQEVATAVGATHVMVVVTGDPPWSAVVRGSDPDLVGWHDACATVGQGPVPEVLRTGRACVVDDVHDHTAISRRWPLLATLSPAPPAPIPGANIRSVLAVPLTITPTTPSATAPQRLLPPSQGSPVSPASSVLGAAGSTGEVGTAEVLGVVVLARGRRPFDAAEADRADAATTGIAEILMRRATEGPADDPLGQLLDERGDVLPQAVGVMCHLYRVAPAEALRLLTAHAVAEDTTLHRVAQGLLSDHDTDPVGPPSRRAER